ncbi:MAG: 4Fe-4S dicluster domain-containing protein [Candidatus Odinarchaeota archaeon]
MSNTDAKKILRDMNVPQNYRNIEITINTSLCPLGCQMCVKACPTSALYFFEVVHVQKELCIGCGACASACPYVEPIKITRTRISDGKTEVFRNLKEFVKTNNAENARKRIKYLSKNQDD